MFVCVCSKHTLCMCQGLGVKTWIKGSGQQRTCLRFVTVSVQTVKHVKLHVRHVRPGSLPAAIGCRENQKAGSCFPSLTYRYCAEGERFNSGNTRSNRGRGVRPARTKVKFNVNILIILHLAHNDKKKATNQFFPSIVFLFPLNNNKDVLLSF